MAQLNVENYKLFRELKKTDFWSNFDKQNIQNINTIITVGNHNLSYWMNYHIIKLYKEFNLRRPISIHFDENKRLMSVDDHDYLDYIIHTIPGEATIKGWYNFPGQFIGK